MAFYVICSFANRHSLPAIVFFAFYLGLTVLHQIRKESSLYKAYAENGGANMTNTSPRFMKTK